MNRRFSLSLLLVATLAGSSACHHKTENAAGQGPGGGAPPTPTVSVAQPERRKILDWDEYPGRLEAVDMVEIRARVTGYLESVHFKEGAEVKKGDLLFVIDTRPYQAALEKSEAELSQALTRSQLASNDLARSERLLKVKAISEEEADSRAKAAREAEAAISWARSELQMARLNVEYTHVTAPISGRIGRKMVTEGNLVNGNQGQSSLLTTIVSQDPIYCYFPADEKAVLKYQTLAREGKSTDMASGESICELELANEKNFPRKGHVDFIDNQIDPATGTLRVRAVFSNPDRTLQPGLFARVRIPASGLYEALLVPAAAIGTDQNQKYVLTVNPKHVVEYKAVALGPMIGQMQVVRSGLTPDERVIVNGLMSARPGSPVNPQEGGASTNASPKESAAK
jgi:RND family efflux transporter MFP subunit